MSKMYANIEIEALGNKEYPINRSMNTIGKSSVINKRIGFIKGFQSCQELNEKNEEDLKSKLERIETFIKSGNEYEYILQAIQGEFDTRDYAKEYEEMKNNEKHIFNNTVDENDLPF